MSSNYTRNGSDPSGTKNDVASSSFNVPRGGIYPFMEGMRQLPPISPYPLFQNQSNDEENDEIVLQGEKEGNQLESTEDGQKKPTKKRRRVIVACDTCRRKKVKCEGLPNPSNTCNNCENMGYTCAFTTESDRSRGRYEILEAQRDTLLAALRSVAPQLASQFEKGELHITSPSGTKGESKRITPKENSQNSQDVIENERNDTQSDFPSSSQAEYNNPMAPDLEDGRPRYYGGSSSFGIFSAIEARMPNPKNSIRSDLNVNFSASASYESEAIKSELSKTPSSTNGQKNNFAVLPTPMPQFPRNSIGWVRELRRKTLIAVGRDDLFASENWFQRFLLPDLELLNELMDFFFQNLHSMFPILHEFTFRRDLENGRAERDSAFRGLVFTILAISSRFFPNDSRMLADQKDANSAGDHWAAASRFYHQVYAASLINVQVLLLSTAFMPASLGFGTCWTVLGTAIRAIFDIGLHTEKAYVGYTPFEQERRRRTFWAAYVLDSILSLNMGRPLGIRSEDCSVRYPLLATEDALTEAERTGGAIKELPYGDQTPCLAGAFIYLIKGVAVVRQVLSTIYEPVKHSITYPGQTTSPSYKDMTIMSKRLDEWISECPAYVQDVRSSPFAFSAAVSQCGRSNIRLYILKPFIYDFRAALPTVKSSQGGSSAKSSTEEESILRRMLLPQCASHARATLQTLQSLQEDRGISFALTFIHQSFFSASTFVLTIWHGTEDEEMLEKDSKLIGFCLSVYNHIEFASVLIQRAHRILRSIASRCISILKDEEGKEYFRSLLRQSGSIRTGIVPSSLNTVGTAASISRINSDSSFTSQTPKSKQISDILNRHGKSSTISASNNSTKPYSALKNDHSEIGSSEINPELESILFPNERNLNDSNLIDFSQQQNINEDVGITPQPQAFPFNGDLSWTDYFNRFLGGLPDPSLGNS